MSVEVYIKDAPAFIADLVKQGVTFEGIQKGDAIVITFTGGF